jgi:hypothetical protein
VIVSTTGLRLAAVGEPGSAGRLGAVDGWSSVVRRMRASMSRLATTPVKPRIIRRGSDLWTPKIAQQASSPRMSSQVPREIPVGRAVR